MAALISFHQSGVKSRRQQTRQLAAIMFTDIVGYTALMGKSSATALDLVRISKEIQKPLVQQHNGKWLKEMGDGAMAQFSTALDAVNCALEIQKYARAEFDGKLRIGIHAGDVTFENEDVYGDGVNIASRLESIADPGGIYISESIEKAMRGQSNIQAKFLGEIQLKNVDYGVRTYALQGVGLPVPDINEDKQLKGGFFAKLERHTKNSKPMVAVIAGILLLTIVAYFLYPKVVPPAEPDELDKSIAVLPFKNMSADDENQYFADGQMEAILNHLSKIRELHVVSSITMMGYRGTTKSIPEIARELGVRYVLGGSVQKAGQKVRINAELIDSKSDEHLWSNYYDVDIIDQFSIQSEIAKLVAEALQATISGAEQAMLESTPTSNLEAYDWYLKGEDYRRRSIEQEDFRVAIQMYEKAVEIDPEFTLAWVGLAASSRHIYWPYRARSQINWQETKRYLDKATSLDPDLAEVQLEKGMYYNYIELNYSKALEILEKLKSDYPENDEVYLSAGAVYSRMGEFQKAFEYMDHARSLSPANWRAWFDSGETLLFLGRYAQAEEYLKMCLDLNPSAEEDILVHLYLATGDIDKARVVLLAGHPSMDDAVWVWHRSEIERTDRNFQEAIRILESTPHELFSNQFAYIPKALVLGLLYYEMSDMKSATSYFEESRKVLEEALKELPDDSRIYSSLGLTYAGLGMKEDAVAAGEKALSIVNIAVDAWTGFNREVEMARILLMTGKFDEAVDKLEFLIRQNGQMSVELLKRDPFWDPLRDMDAFKVLIANPQYQINLEQKLKLSID